MKFRDPETGGFKELYTKAADTLPVGTVVDYEGTEIPAGWEEVDDGWKNLTLLNSFTNLSNIYPVLSYRKIGSVIYLRGMAKPPAANTTNPIAKLPAGFRPSKTLYASYVTDDTVKAMFIETSGEIRLTGTGTGWISLNMSFPLDD